MKPWLSRKVALLALGAIVVVVLGGAVVRHLFATPTYTITARFASTPGLYNQNKVSILGVPTGKITSVQARSAYVEVTMEMPSDVRLPVDVRAILLAPNPISDRTVELFPAFTGGPVLRAGATIPESRTSIPVGVDEVIKQVDSLASALGPRGVDKNGALSSAIGRVATLVDGRGQDVHDLLKSLSQALPSLTGRPDQISRLVTSLKTLTGVLAAHDDAINAVFTRLTQATEAVSSDHADLGAAIANLESGLVAVTAFVRDNRSTISTATARLAAVSTSLIADQKALMKTFSGAAAGFDGFNRMIDLNARCADPKEGKRCPVAFGRLDSPVGIEGFVAQYCPPVIRSAAAILVHSIPGLAGVMGLPSVDNASTLDSLCVAEKAIVQGHDGSPGAPKVPDPKLSKYLR